MQLSSHKLFKLLSILVVAAMVLTGCTAVAPAAQAPAPAAGEAAAAPAADNWWATAAEAAGCKDVTIRGISESTPPTRFASDVLGPAV